MADRVLAPHPQHHHSQSGPPPPPSITSAHSSSNQPPYDYGPARRGSLGGASPPALYGAPPHDAPPPPPSFPRPHMPPPSSPQQPQSHLSHVSTQRAPFPSSSYGGGRELPGLASGHRQGGSMSISSLIGGDSSTSNHAAQNQASSPSTSASATPIGNHAMQPPSPRRVTSGSRSDFPQFRRHPSPDRHAMPNSVTRMSEGHGYSASSPPRPYSSSHGSPERGRQNLPSASQPYRPMTFQGSRLYQSSPNDAQSRDSRQSGIPPRPSSQPSAPVEAESKSSLDALGPRRAAYGANEGERRRTMGESHHSRPNTSELLGGVTQEQRDRDRPVTVQPVSQSAFSPPRDQRMSAIPQETSQQSQRNLFWRNQAGAGEEGHRDLNPGSAPLFRLGFGGPAAPSQAQSPFANASGDEQARIRAASESHRLMEVYHPPPTSDPNSTERRRAEQFIHTPSSSSNSYTPRSVGYEQQQRRFGEEMLPQKSFLGNLGGPEANRRTGRASPLPQAVQGAQAQPAGIGGDPNIKSEFGRMFSGLGSGLGTGPPGITTPSRQSPLPQGSQESLGGDFMSRVNSQGGRKPKRVKDEDNTLDSDGDGRGTPNLMGPRGAKRNKHSHAAHHHHHHAHPHHHHHHHHKAEDEAASLPPNAAAAPFNTARYGSAQPQSSTPAQMAHHHHHYHTGPHHHHHAPRPSQSAIMPPPKPVIPEHDISSVLADAAKQPRRHLGSQMYEAKVELPKANSQLDEQFGYSSKPKPLPDWDFNPVNCTYTIRVPHQYLRPRERSQIVTQRHLWGAAVYTSNSDPIAAAMHSGWLRGEWNDSVNVESLDPRLSDPNDPSDAEDTLEKKPKAPVVPPPEMSLHITLLILPTLKEYFAMTEYGISSRQKLGYDGWSFTIHKMQWVEEGYGVRGQERGAAALKKRLDASNALMALMNGERSFGKMNGSGVATTGSGMTKLHA
ncbi:Rxt3-domain-containing protein [Lophium mytilinum]|uniref:Rxt3-domain-containing protein n=1 Tax=Lophium mytilinum TaxID=390894 RepID=A0A6A6QZZ4_9PEZI|nr:Rxt3-domain-containing protein [Lophium mytilinum]